MLHRVFFSGVRLICCRPAKLGPAQSVYTYAHSCLTVCAEISRKKRALTKTKVTEMTNKAGKEFKTKCESVSGMRDVG